MACYFWCRRCTSRKSSCEKVVECRLLWEPPWREFCRTFCCCTIWWIKLSEKTFVSSNSLTSSIMGLNCSACRNFGLPPPMGLICFRSDRLEGVLRWLGNWLGENWLPRSGTRLWRWLEGPGEGFCLDGWEWSVRIDWSFIARFELINSSLNSAHFSDWRPTNCLIS